MFLLRIDSYESAKRWCANRRPINQCSFVYPYPSVSALEGGNSDHGPRKTRTKTQTTPDSAFIGERKNSDHGLSFGCFWGRGRRRGSQLSFPTIHSRGDSRVYGRVNDSCQRASRLGRCHDSHQLVCNKIGNMT